MPLGIARQQTSGGSERAVMLQRGECVCQLALASRGIVHAIGREQGQVQRFRDFDGDPVSIFFVAMEMPLHFDINVALTKNFREALYRFQCRLRTFLRERRGQWTFGSAGQANQSDGMFD